MPSSTSSIVRTYSGPNLLQIAMPMGGIGAGYICLNGFGGLQDFSIRNKPSLTALPDGHGYAEAAAIAVLHLKCENATTRLIEGPMPPERVYDQGLQGSERTYQCGVVGTVEEPARIRIVR